MLSISILSLPTIIALAFNTYLLLLLISRKYRAKVSTVFAFLIISFIFWDIFEIAMNNAKNADLFLIWTKFSWTSVAFLAGIYLHLAIIFPKIKAISKNKLIYLVLYLPGFIIIYFVWFTDLFITGSWEALLGGVRLPTYGIMLHVYAAYAMIFFSAGLCLFFQIWKKSETKRERKQGKWMFFATLIPIVGALSTNVILPIFKITVFQLGTSFTVITALMIANAIHKFRLTSVTPSVAAETIISMIPNVVILLGADQKILYLDSKLLNILGYKKTDLIGEHVRKILSGNTKVFGLPWQDLEKKKELEKTRIELLSKNGDGIQFDFTGTISVVDDELVGLVGIGTHIKNK